MNWQGLRIKLKLHYAIVVSLIEKYNGLGPVRSYANSCYQEPGRFIIFEIQTKGKGPWERQYFKRLPVISQDQGYGSLINSVDCLPKFGDWKLTALSRRLEKVVEADWVKPGF